MKVFVLEDDTHRIEEFKKRFAERNWESVFTDTAKEAIEHLNTTKFDLIFLDHDLGGQVYVPESNENTGSAVVRAMIENSEKTNMDTPIIIHSLNTPAADSMAKNLADFGFSSIWPIGFIWEKASFDHILTTS